MSTYSMNFFKKGLGSIVTVTLLLIVVVVSIISFQGWYDNYASSIQNSVETDLYSGVNTQIERVSGDILYFRNGKNETITINKVTVENQDCNVSRNISMGIHSIDLKNCSNTIDKQKAEIVVYTNNSVYSYNTFLDTYSTDPSTNFNSNTSTTNGCVPADSLLHVGSSQEYSTLLSAYNDANNGDAIIIHPGTYSGDDFKSGGVEIKKAVNFFGSTGNASDVTISANIGSNWFRIGFNTMNVSNVTIGFYHIEFTRNQYSWRDYFGIKGDTSNDTFILQNTILSGDLSGMYPIKIQQDPKSRVVLDHVDYLDSPYTIVFGSHDNHAAIINTSSLYVPGFTSEYYQGNNFDIVKNNYSSNSQTHGISTFNESNADWPCGYTP